MYTTMNQPMHQIQQSTNNTTIIHPWQNYKFSSTQLWSCCSAGSLSHTSQTAAAWLSPHITVVHVMVFKVFQEWFSSAKPWTTLMNDLICLNCDMDDLPRCFTSAAFNRRNDGTLFSKSVPYLIGPANRRQNLYATQQQSPKTSLYTTIFHFYKYDSTRQSSCFCKLVRPVWRNRLFRSFEWVCCNYRPTTMSMENSTPDDDIVHAACLHHLLATGIWRLGVRARKLHHSRYIITTWINTISDHWAGR